MRSPADARATGRNQVQPGGLSPILDCFLGEVMTRLALFLPCVLAWTACGSEPAATGPATDVVSNGPPASLVLEEWTIPTLEMVDPGAEPRVQLRVPIAEPSPAVLVRWQNSFETVAKRGLSTTAPSVVRQKRSLLVTPSAGPDAATVDFVVTEASETARGGPPTDDAVARELVGRGGRWVTTDRCAVARAGIDDTAATAALPHLPGLLRSAAESCPLLPEVPVGVGARWTTTEPTTDGATRVTAWVLTRVDDDRAAMTFQTRDSPDNLAEGRVGLDRTHVIPLRFDAAGRTVRARPDPSAPERTIRWTTTWEMHADRKALPTVP